MSNIPKTGLDSKKTSSQFLEGMLPVAYTIRKIIAKELCNPPPEKKITLDKNRIQKQKFSIESHKTVKIISLVLLLSGVTCLGYFFIYVYR